MQLGDLPRAQMLERARPLPLRRALLPAMLLVPACATSAVHTWAVDEDASSRGVRVAVAAVALPACVVADVATFPFQLAEGLAGLGSSLIALERLGTVAEGFVRAQAALGSLDPRWLAGAPSDPAVVVLAALSHAWNAGPREPRDAEPPPPRG